MKQAIQMSRHGDYNASLTLLNWISLALWFEQYPAGAA